MPRGRRRAKKYLWAPFGTGLQTLAASAAVSVDLLALIRTAVPLINNFTVVRIRGFEAVRPTACSGSLLLYDSGILVVTQPAFDAGATPDPENDDASYMYRNSPIWSANLCQETAAGTFSPGMNLYQIDVRAKRRVDQADNTLAYAIKNRTAIASQFNVEGMILLDLR